MRLTARNEYGEAIFPACNSGNCYGMCGECNGCAVEHEIAEKLCRYEEAEEEKIRREAEEKEALAFELEQEKEEEQKQAGTAILMAVLLIGGIMAFLVCKQFGFI